MDPLITTPKTVYGRPSDAALERKRVNELKKLSDWAIQKVRNHCVFGSTNRLQDTVRTGGWSTTTNAFVYKWSMQGLLAVQLFAHEMRKLGVSDEDWEVIRTAREAVVPMLVRSANCGHRAALALHFILEQRMEAGLSVRFAEIEASSYINHIFLELRKETAAVYCDPWLEITFTQDEWQDAGKVTYLKLEDCNIRIAEEGKALLDALLTWKEPDPFPLELPVRRLPWLWTRVQHMDKPQEQYARWVKMYKKERLSFQGKLDRLSCFQTAQSCIRPGVYDTSNRELFLVSFHYFYLLELWQMYPHSVGLVQELGRVMESCLRILAARGLSFAGLFKLELFFAAERMHFWRLMNRGD